MQRRKFIRVSGLSAAFLFKPSSQNTAEKILGFPDRVSVRCKGEWFSLKGKDDHWSFQDIEVNFKDTYAYNGISVHAQAPDRELENIKCSWDRHVYKKSQCLNDHWERGYGDLSWESIDIKRRSPWYIMFSDGANTLACGVKTGPNSICYWQVSGEILELVMDTNSGGSGVMLGNRILRAADYFAIFNIPGENPFLTDIRFCKMMCDKPVLPKQPVYGINDWYFAYGNNSKDLILQTTAMMAELVTDHSNKPFSVIDMGWSKKPLKSNEEYVWGDDFTQGNASFGDMDVVASEIMKLGMRPGLWTRPLQANAADKPTLLIPVRKDQQDLKERYLDPTIPENLQRITHTISLYKNWGFELVKHDYTSYDLFGRWGFEMMENMTVPGWHFQDRSKTNAEIILELYGTIRAAAGEMYLIGCNTFSHLSAGIFEINRIGDDTSGNEWARTLKMGVNSLAFRLPQHNTFYAADGDCVGLTTKVSWEKNKQWLQLLAESSAPLFISAQPEATGAEQKLSIKKAFANAAMNQPRAEPLDWMTNPRPSEWKLNGKQIHFDWN